MKRRLIILILIIIVGVVICPKMVYLHENGEPVPFMAVGYNGNVLLLRRDILTIREFNGYSSYYEDSSIDRYLNGEYLDSLAEDIAMSEIEITTDDSIGISGTDTRTIKRKVFLLSLTELGIDSPTAAKEGRKLLPLNRVAFMDGEPRSWWLRTPSTYYESCPYAIGVNGEIDIGNAYDENGIRPALCVSIKEFCRIFFRKGY